MSAAKTSWRGPPVAARLCRALLRALDPSRIRSLIRNEGWQAQRGDQRFWNEADQQVVVLPPDEARGLEFDGVVVSQPADFSENFGRRGPLYTSLTRPNRELSVVHSKPLPEELRPRKR